MNDSIYSMSARDFQMSLSANLIGLCAHCLVHSSGAKCGRCGRLLVGKDGNPIDQRRQPRQAQQIQAIQPKPPRQPVQPQPPRKVVAGPYQDGTSPACTAIRHPEPCEHYYVESVRGHCRLARTASFQPSKCRAMIEAKQKLIS